MKVEFKGIDDYADKLAKLGYRAEGVCKAALYDYAAVYADTLKSMTPVSFPNGGDLRDSIVIRHFKTENGVISTKVTFDGYDRKGAPNALKAAALESGTRDGRIPKTHFISKAKRAAAGAADFAFRKKVDELIDQIIKEE